MARANSSSGRTRRTFGVGRRRGGGFHAGEPFAARAAQQPQQEGFDLIVGVMGEGDDARAMGMGRAGEELMAQLPRRHLQGNLVGGGLATNVSPVNDARQFEPAGRLAHQRLIGIARPATELVVEMRDDELPPARAGEAMQQVEQDHEVKPARDGDDHTLAGCQQLSADDGGADSLSQIGHGSSVPADGPALVLLFEPGHQGLEILHHRSGGKVLPGGLTQHLAPVLGGAFGHDVAEEIAGLLVAGVAAMLDGLMENLTGNVLVELELQLVKGYSLSTLFSCCKQAIQIHRKVRNCRAGHASARPVDASLGILPALRLAMDFDLLLRSQHQPTFLHAGAGVGAEFGAVIVVAAHANLNHQFGGVRVIGGVVVDGTPDDGKVGLRL